MATQLAGQPVLILKEGSERRRGREAQSNNILAAKTVANVVKSTLGPRGMDKMLVDSLGDVVITNDGATILKEMDIEHPAAKMMVEVAKNQESEVGDGTTSVVVIAGELLKRAEDLIDQDVHPTIIARGYRLAAVQAVKTLNKIGKDVSIDDNQTLKKIAMTAMTGKGSEKAREPLADIVVKAVKAVMEKENSKITVDKDEIKLEKKAGGAIADTELVEGVVVDKERVHSGMPKSVKKAKIAVVDAALEIKKTEIDARINITNPDQMKAFLEEEEHMLKEMVEKIKASGANVLFCQKGIDDLAQHYLSKAGIYAVRRAKESDMKKLAKATGATVITSLEDLTPEMLGYAGLVEEVKIGEDNMTFVRECKNPKSVTILIRGGTEHIVDEIERSLEDSVGVVAATVESQKIVAGGGAPEIEVAKALREYARSVGGKEQLAVNAFADAVEEIPRALAENAGLDPIDTLVELRAKHEKEKDGSVIGLDVYSGKPVDMLKEGVIEPLKVKTLCINSAAEVAEMILRIDDIIAAGKKETPSMPPGGKGEMPGGGDFD